MNDVQPKLQKTYTIVGQGLAGSILAYMLIQEGQNVQIFDASEVSSSSKIAAGIYNPVTGKRLVKTWLADEIFPFLEDFYPKLETELEAKFFHPVPVFHPFADVAMQKFFKSDHVADDFSDFASAEFENTHRQEIVNSMLGGIVISHTGWVDLKVMLAAFRDYFLERGVLIETTSPPDPLSLKRGGVIRRTSPPLFKERGSGGEVVIYCQGFEATKNPYFNYLPFNPVKGEILDIKIPEFDIQEIVNQGVFVIPLGDNQYRLGATYTWDELDNIPTETGRNSLTEKYHKLMKPSMEILSHQAGVRPATKDRRPFIGMHPEVKNIGIFNGLGSKGVSLAPYFAKQFVDFLVYQKELHPEVNINRFASLYLGIDRC
jgi:glycine/D-amino acid oxidase-like deaminating enzyme